MPATEAAPPATTAPAATQATEAPSTERAPAEFMADAMGDFAEMDQGKPPTSVPRDEKGKFTKASEKPREQAPAKAEESKPAAEESKPAQEETPAQTEAPKPVKAAELRTAYEGLKKRVKEELEPELQRLRAKAAEAEGKPTKEAEVLLDKIKGLEEDNSRLRKTVALHDYKQDETYQKTYEEPYRKAYAETISEFLQLKVREQTGEDDEGQPTYSERPAQEADMLRLANMDPADMYKTAEQMFGTLAASDVIANLKTLRRLGKARRDAETEAAEKSVKWKSEREAQALARSQAAAKSWSEINKSLEEKFPKAFKPEDGNADDKSAHTKGFALADLLFTGASALSPEQVEALPSSFRDTIKAGQPLSDAQRVQLHALARLKMANHDRKVAALKKAVAEIAELKKSLAEYEKSEPDASRAGSGERPAAGKDWLESAGDELRALDR